MMIKLARKAIKTEAVSQNRSIEIEGGRGRFCPANSGNLVCGPPRARPVRGEDPEEVAVQPSRHALRYLKVEPRMAGKQLI